MESEFIALDKADEEAEWHRNFLEDIPNWPKPVPAVCIHCDSQAAIGRVRNVMYNGKSRHIRRRHDTVRQLLSSGIITIYYVKSKDNIVDPLTVGPHSRTYPFWRIRTESEMPCYHSITQNPIFAEAISNLGKPINIYI